MAGWTVSIAMALLLSSQVSSTFSPTSFIKDMCVGWDFVHIDYKFCVEALASEPGVVAATNLVSISIALIAGGISNATKTQSYVQQVLTHHPGLKADYRYILQQCDAAYNYYHVSFKSALMEVKEKHYETANYDLEVAVADGIIGQCKTALGSKKIKDAVISKGNDFMIVFGKVAALTVDRLHPHRRI